MKKIFKILMALALILVAGVLYLKFIFGPTHYRVKGNAMLPTYASTDSWSHLFDFTKVELGQNICTGCVVVFNTSRGVQIARIIGAPQDRIVVMKKDRLVKINGTPQVYTYVAEYGVKGKDDIIYTVLDEYATKDGNIEHHILQSQSKTNIVPFDPFLNTATALGNESVELAKKSCAENATEVACKVGTGSVFVIGDNRTSTLYGLIPISSVIGVANPLKQ